MGKPHEINCTLYTVNYVNVSISWIGPNGVITNDSSRITVIPTTSDGYIHTSTLQFSYISEEDENTSYSCTASTKGSGNKSVSYQIGNLSSKLICHSYICSYSVNDIELTILIM